MVQVAVKYKNLYKRYRRASKYLFKPVQIKNKNLFLRKRSLSPGYELSHIVVHTQMGYDIKLTHFGYIETLDQIEIYLKNAYNIHIKL